MAEIINALRILGPRRVPGHIKIIFRLSLGPAATRFNSQIVCIAIPGVASSRCLLYMIKLDGRCEISVHSELTYYVDHTEYFIYDECTRQHHTQQVR